LPLSNTNLKWKTGMTILLSRRQTLAGSLLAVPALAALRTEAQGEGGQAVEAILVQRRFAGPGVSRESFGFRWFPPSIWRYRRSLGHVLLASLFVQLFALVACASVDDVAPYLVSHYHA
jgi:hypothetical protein